MSGIIFDAVDAKGSASKPTKFENSTWNKFCVEIQELAPLLISITVPVTL